MEFFLRPQNNSDWKAHEKKKYPIDSMKIPQHHRRHRRRRCLSL